RGKASGVPAPGALSSGEIAEDRGGVLTAWRAGAAGPGGPRQDGNAALRQRRGRGEVFADSVLELPRVPRDGRLVAAPPAERRAGAAWCDDLVRVLEDILDAVVPVMPCRAARGVARHAERDLPPQDRLLRPIRDRLGPGQVLVEIRALLVGLIPVPGTVVA